ncbi:MAG: hypothetical protein ACREQY_01420 [Candidatus Binatia bacterium]
MMIRLDDRTEMNSQPLDVQTILENVVQLDELLDEGSRRGLEALPFLELSKHVRIRRS